MPKLDTAPPGAKRPRAGRPPNAEAGAVEERILNAATALFLEHGYEGVSFEQISSMAHAGKATIYARYANKEALFSAVIRKSIDSRLTLVDSVAGALPPGDRLTQTAMILLERMLTSEAVSLTRVVIGEAPRFPSLARLVDEFGRQRAIDLVWRVMAADYDARALPARQARKAPDKVAAHLFLDQLYAPLMLRALVGEDLDALRGEIPQRVSDAVSRSRK
jgi:AcrR family transcriptional regulator